MTIFQARFYTENKNHLKRNSEKNNPYQLTHNLRQSCHVAHVNVHENVNVRVHGYYDEKAVNVESGEGMHHPANHQNQNSKGLLALVHFLQYSSKIVELLI